MMPSKIVVAGALALAMLGAVALPARAQAPAAAALYHDHCSVCHGDAGNGDSRARGSMRPPPRDFTGPEARELSRARMIASVVDGRPDTAMAPWKGRLSHAQIEAVVDYIRDSFMAPAGRAEGSPGARIYARTCSVCHGDTGSGASWAAANLDPRPRNFTAPGSAAELSRNRMLHSVTYGRPDTAMPGFGTQLAKADIEAVVDYVRASFMRTAPARAGGQPAAAGGEQPHHAGAGAHDHDHDHDHGHDHDAFLARAAGAPFANGLVGNVARGADSYRRNCVACHGEDGDGQGPRAYFIMPKPRNFTHPGSRSSLDRPHLFQAIARGSVGTEMPAWEKVLDAQGIADIAEYVYQRFILGGGPAATVAVTK